MIYGENDWARLESITSDVAIVGAGAAGITLGLSLESKGFSVNIFEGGGEDFSEVSQSLYSGSIVGRDLPYGLQFSRMRFLGGSTNCWGAGCGVFGNKELLFRDWVSKSRWPIEYNVLVPFYQKASQFLDLPDVLNAEKNRDTIINGFDNPGLYYTKKRNFKREFTPELQASETLNVFLQANFKEFREEHPHSIKEIELAGFGNSSLICRAKVMVLCCGGVENARLLLNSRDNAGEAFGNGNDLVGRYFSDHPITPLATVFAPKESVLHNLERVSAAAKSSESDVLFIPSFKIPDSIQRERKILNSTVSFQMENPPLTQAQLSAWSLKKGWKESGFNGLSLDHMTDVLSNPIEVARALYERRTGGSRFAMRIQMEQEPNFNSRVKLSTERDRFGHYKTLLDWQFTELDRRTIDETLKYCSEIFTDGQIGILEVDSSIVNDPDAVPSDLRGGQHHSGTTRMGISEQDGVVDLNLKVFGTSNLYVLGSSVMPTNSWVNPTFTIIALAFRLGDHIEKTLNER
jgi:choline dehydrogenase-like flavoprotein